MRSNTTDDIQIDEFKLELDKAYIHSELLTNQQVYNLYLETKKEYDIHPETSSVEMQKSLQRLKEESERYLSHQSNSITFAQRILAFETEPNVTASKTYNVNASPLQTNNQSTQQNFTVQIFKPDKPGQTSRKTITALFHEYLLNQGKNTILAISSKGIIYNFTKGSDETKYNNEHDLIANWTSAIIEKRDSSQNKKNKKKQGLIHDLSHDYHFALVNITAKQPQFNDLESAKNQFYDNLNTQTQDSFFVSDEFQQIISNFESTLKQLESAREDQKKKLHNHILEPVLTNIRSLLPPSFLNEPDCLLYYTQITTEEETYDSQIQIFTYHKDSEFINMWKEITKFYIMLHGTQTSLILDQHTGKFHVFSENTDPKQHRANIATLEHNYATIQQHLTNNKPKQLSTPLLQLQSNDYQFAIFTSPIKTKTVNMKYGLLPKITTELPFFFSGKTPLPALTLLMQQMSQANRPQKKVLDTSVKLPSEQDTSKGKLVQEILEKIRNFTPYFAAKPPLHLNSIDLFTDDDTQQKTAYMQLLPIANNTTNLAEILIHSYFTLQNIQTSIIVHRDNTRSIFTEVDDELEDGVDIKWLLEHVDEIIYHINNPNKSNHSEQTATSSELTKLLTDYSEGNYEYILLIKTPMNKAAVSKQRFNPKPDSLLPYLLLEQPIISQLLSLYKELNMRLGQPRTTSPRSIKNSIAIIGNSLPEDISCRFQSMKYTLNKGSDEAPFNLYLKTFTSSAESFETWRQLVQYFILIQGTQSSIIVEQETGTQYIFTETSNKEEHRNNIPLIQKQITHLHKADISNSFNPPLHQTLTDLKERQYSYSLFSIRSQYAVDEVEETENAKPSSCKIKTHLPTFFSQATSIASLDALATEIIRSDTNSSFRDTHDAKQKTGRSK